MEKIKKEKGGVVMRKTLAQDGKKVTSFFHNRSARKAFNRYISDAKKEKKTNT